MSGFEFMETIPVEKFSCVQIIAMTSCVVITLSALIILVLFILIRNIDALMLRKKIIDITISVCMVCVAVTYIVCSCICSYTHTVGYTDIYKVVNYNEIDEREFEKYDYYYAEDNTWYFTEITSCR